MTPRDLWTQFLAALGYVPAADPRVAEARRQQQAVTGWSVKVHPRAFEWQAAAACAERGLYGAAAEWAIRASSEHRTCRVEADA